MAARRGFYSNIIVYDERRRYYYINPQKNKPFLDDEIRDMGIGLLDQVRRSIQNTYGDVAAPYKEYASTYSTVDAFKVRQATDTDRNFLVKGGYSLDHPAVLYAKGFYIFLTGDLEYKHQMYPSDTIDLQTESNKYLTLTPIPALTTPIVDRIDIVYVDLHFEETTAASGTDANVYRDTGLKNPVVGTETANRLRAVIDVKVREGWTATIDKNIFMHSEFLGGVTGDDVDPTDNHYKIPIAVIYRDAFQNTITDSQIVDLLSLYNKRVMSLEEISYRVRNGGYTETGVYELGLSGFSPQHAGARYDEGAFATGLNQGLGTEALNTDAVTPRILDNDGKFFMRSLMVGHDTGIVTYETGPEDLGTGEVIVQDLSARSVYVGYGVTGITGMREYVDSLSAVVRGETGRGGLSVMNLDGVTGSKTAYVRAVHGGVQENFFVSDYKGRIGLNTFTPGWDKPLNWEDTDRYNDGLGGVTGVNVVQEINGSLRLRDHVFADKDVYVNRDLFGQTWKIPAALSDQSPAMFGFTGIPAGGFTGIAESIAAVIFKRGIAVMGDTGIVGYSYTGIGAAGQYECFDSEGRRMFTIGDLGDDFDRIVKSLYGVSMRKAFTSFEDDFTDQTKNHSFLYLPDYDEIQAGDIVNYDILLEGGAHVTGILTITTNGMPGVEQIRDHIIDNTGFLVVGGPIGPDRPRPYARAFDYKYYVDPDATTYDGIDDKGKYLLRSGISLGVQIVVDLFGVRLGFRNNGKIILKDMPEDPVHVVLDSVASFTVSRPSVLTPPSVSVPFVQGSYYGAVEFGGALTNVKFAKLDLGEAADGWLFNGDVYFNGNGFMNRVTFSPNVIFRDDVFVYGTMFADQLNFNFANVANLIVRNSLLVNKESQFVEGFSAGTDSLTSSGFKTTYPDLLAYVKGRVLSQSLVLRDVTDGVTTLGSLFQKSGREGDAYVHVGGTVDGTLIPYGIHLIDSRAAFGMDEENRFKEIVLDASDGQDNFRKVSLRVEGNVITKGNFMADYFGVAVDSINPDYKLQVNGRAQINDILEVKALRFIGAEAPEGSPDIITPENVTVISSNMSGKDKNNETFLNNATILREKKFTSYDKISLFNKNDLGAQGGVETGLQYYNNYIISTDPIAARWARDNVTYTEEQIVAIETASGSTNGTVVVQNIPDSVPEYRRYSCERVTICSFGEIVMEWKGYVSDPGDDRTLEISKYEFTTNYFRGNGGSYTINWLNGLSRYGDENRIVHVEGSIVNTDTGIPTIYTINKTLGLYIPLTSWWQAAKAISLTAPYKNFVLYYPWETVQDKFNVMSFSEQVSGADSDWKLGVYPRLIQQSSAYLGTDKVYTATWSLDLIVLPLNDGLISNLIGKLYINFDQR